LRIALFDADPSEQALVEQLLERSGFECRTYNDAPALVADARQQPFDALIVDWKGHPARGGAVLGHARATAKRTPTLMMVASGREEDIIAGLSCGADDYLIKPIRPSELIARLQALLRRAYPNETLERYTFEPYRFEPEPSEVVIAASGDGKRPEQRVILTQKEFDLCLLLFRNAGRPLSRNHIREIVWGGDADISSRTMDTHVSRLRTKLGLNSDSTFRVMPVYGYGYRLDRVDA
jgi:DNA-binding response OmpR family regulator